MINKILVSTDALFEVLQALNGPHHLVLELQASMRLPPIFNKENNPIGKLMQEYSIWKDKNIKTIHVLMGLTDYSPSTPIKVITDSDEAANITKIINEYLATNQRSMDNLSEWRINHPLCGEGKVYDDYEVVEIPLT